MASAYRMLRADPFSNAMNLLPVRDQFDDAARDIFLKNI